MVDHLQQGIHSGVPMDVYVADPCPEPSVSTGVICDIIGRSPRHAWQEHPRLGGNADDGSSRADIGSAAHDMLLAGNDRVVFIDAPDWRTKVAKAARDEARANGQIPLLTKYRDVLHGMMDVARPALQSFDSGDAEQTLIWQDDGVWCRSRPDWISADRKLVIDYKTATCADPATWIRSSLIPGGYDVQAALALRGLDVLAGKTSREWVFLVQEIEAPYACSLVGVGQEMGALAQRKVAAGLKLWGKCLKDNHWPAYDKRIHWADVPAYAAMDFEVRALTLGDAA